MIINCIGNCRIVPVIQFQKYLPPDVAYTWFEVYPTTHLLSGIQDGIREPYFLKENFIGKVIKVML
jgi:hypothetical protein